MKIANPITKGKKHKSCNLQQNAKSLDLVAGQTIGIRFGNGPSYLLFYVSHVLLLTFILKLVLKQKFFLD